MSYRLKVCFLCSAMIFTYACASSQVNKIEEASAVDGSKQEENQGLNISLGQLKDSCLGGVRVGIEKRDKTLELISKDGNLWRFNLEKQEGELVRELSNGGEDDFLLPNEGVNIHFSDKAMIQESATGVDYFVLSSSAQPKQVYVGDDLKSIALHSPEPNRFNIWDASDQFSGIRGGETVQEFLRRQSPDFTLGFPQEPRALDLGNKRRAVVVIDSPEENKQGLIYLLDEEREKGRLFNLGRTNSVVTAVDLSPDAQTVVVLDENGKIFVTPTLDKGFKAWASRFSGVRWVSWLGTDLLVGEAAKISALNPYDGALKWSKEENIYHHCQTFAQDLLCISDGELDLIEKDSGNIKLRLLVSGKSYAFISPSGVKGTLSTECIVSE